MVLWEEPWQLLDWMRQWAHCWRHLPWQPWPLAGDWTHCWVELPEGWLVLGYLIWRLVQCWIDPLGNWPVDLVVMLPEDRIWDVGMLESQDLESSPL